MIATLGNGRECSVNDFAIVDDNSWDSISKSLLQAAGTEAKQRDIQQTKQDALQEAGLTIASEWYGGQID